MAEASETNGTGAEQKGLGRATRVLIALAIAVGLLVLAFLAVLAISKLAEVTTPAVRLTEITELPTDDAWTITHPLAVAESEDADTIPYLTGYGVDQDRALVLYSAVNADGSRSADTELSLLDTRNGETLWSIPWQSSDFAVVSAPAQRPYLVSSTGDAISTITALDPESGRVLSDSSILGSAVAAPLPDRATGVSALGDDILIEVDGQLSRVSPETLDQPQWSLNLGGHEPEVAGSLVFVSGRAYALDSGESVPWDSGAEVHYLPSNAAIVGVTTRTGDDPIPVALAGYSPDGSERWSTELSDSSTVLFSGRRELVLGDADAHEVFAIDLASGDERWRTAIAASAESTAGGSDYSGVLLLSLADRFIGMDLDSGEQLFELRFPAAEGQPRVLGATPVLFYLAGAEGSSLGAYNTRTGDELWTLPSTGTSYVVAWGGNLVKVALASDEPQAALRGIAP